MFDKWFEAVENTVYVYFSEDLEVLSEMYGLDLNYFYENSYSPMDVVYKIQSIIEEEDFDDD